MEGTQRCRSQIGGKWAYDLYDKKFPNFYEGYLKPYGVTFRTFNLGETFSYGNLPKVKSWKEAVDHLKAGGQLAQELLEDEDFMVIEDLETFLADFAVPNDFAPDIDIFHKVNPKTGEGEKGDDLIQQGMILSPEAIKFIQAGQPLYQGKKPRAMIEFKPDGVDITKFENADLSWFLHETGHLC